MRRKRREAGAADAPAPRRIDAATRVRLMALDVGQGSVELGGGLACVETPGPAGRDAAKIIAHAVIGPREPHIDGYVEIGGQRIDLTSLPTPLLRPSAPRTVDDRMLQDIWQSICAPRRARVAAAHAARRLERHRTIAAIERARERIALVPEPTRAPEPADAPTGRVERDDVARDLQDLVDAVDRLVPVPSPEALRVASEIEYLLANPPLVVDAGETDLEALEATLSAARATVADIAGVVPPIVRRVVAKCHYDVTDAESALFTSSRKNRDAALARYQAALTREREALAEAGVESYVSFLVATVAGVGTKKATEVDLQRRLRAELELAQAEAAVEEARKQLGALPPAEHAARRTALEAHAAELLGHAPGDDPVAELCAVRVAHPDADDIREQLRRRLAEFGVDGGDDLVDAARKFIRDRDATAAPGNTDEDDQPRYGDAPRVDDEGQRDLELATLLEQRAEHEAALASMEAELEVLDTQRARAVSELAPAGVTLVIATLLERYRDGQLLAGRLPLVLDRTFDAFDTTRCAAAVDLLAKADDVQVIVVTREKVVAEVIAGTGAPRLQWPMPIEVDVPTVIDITVDGERAANADGPVTALWRDDASDAADVTPIVAMCGEHSQKVAAASCAHCQRGCCIECLVYVPGDDELWCAECVHSIRPEDLRAANN